MNAVRSILEDSYRLAESKNSIDPGITEKAVILI